MKAAILLTLLSLPAFGELTAGMRAAQAGDFTTAIAELRPAAEANSVAQTFLGLMYQDGKGVAKEYVEAYKWLTLASKKERKAVGLRSSLVGKMTPTQISEGERLAEAWKPDTMLFVPPPKIGPVIQKPRLGA